MKRIITIFIALIMTLSLFACDGTTGSGNGGKTYTGKLDDVEGTKLVVSGNKATFSVTVTEDDEIEDGKAYTMKQTVVQTGIIESNENGTLTIVFNKTGASASIQMQLSGEGAADYKAEYKALFEEMLEDGAIKNAYIKMIDGKKVSMKYGDDLWEDLGPGSDSVIVVQLDETNGTFTQLEDSVG